MVTSWNWTPHPMRCLWARLWDKTLIRSWPNSDFTCWATSLWNMVRAFAVFESLLRYLLQYTYGKTEHGREFRGWSSLDRQAAPDRMGGAWVGAGDRVKLDIVLVKAFYWLGEDHPHYRGPSLLLKVKELTPSKNTLRETLRITFDQICCHPMAQPSWHIQLIITGR